MENYKDPYEVLGVSRDAKEQDITSAYRKLAKQYHPDLNPGDEVAAKKMAEINSAYDAIKNGTADSYSTGTYGNGPYNGYNPYGNSQGSYYNSSTSSNGRTTYYYYSSGDPSSSGGYRYYKTSSTRTPPILRLFAVIMVIRIVLWLLSSIFSGVFGLFNNINRQDYQEYRENQTYERDYGGDYGDWT